MVIEEHARLELFLPDGRIFEISESDLIQNSLSVTSQCVNGNTFGFGCVSPAQLSVKFRIKDQDIGRYDVYGAAIILYSWFGKHPPEDGGKRGVFNVTAVTKNNDIFTISASDNVCLLDTEAFNQTGNAVYQMLGTTGELWNAWNALQMIVDGGLAQQDFWKNPLVFHMFPKENNFTRIPNSSALFDGYGVSTCEEVRWILLLSGEESDNIRDYTAWLAEYMGGFIHAGNDGDIQFHLFETPYYHPEPKRLDHSEFEQNSLEIAGFQIYLYSSKVILEDRQFNSCGIDQKNENGVVNLESVIQNNPFVEFIYKYRGLSLYPIVEALHYYQRNIQIRPFSGTYHGNEYLHLGQYIEITDKDGISYGTTITNITWKFRGGQQIRCVGEDSRTLSQARKRSQAIRMGERLKTQINRTESNLRTEMGNMSGNMKDISENQTDQWNAIQDQQDQINALWNALNGG
ncbi:MAG: hypothetical protein K2H29_09400 [Oscillospiraceae bacterium]|nr:hypothetical protein [Oscillospiraceae bacterium]